MQIDDTDEIDSIDERMNLGSGVSEVEHVEDGMVRVFVACEDIVNRKGRPEVFVDNYLFK